MLLGDFLNPGNRFKLPLVPIPGVIRLPKPAEFRRKTALLRLIAVFVFAAQKAPGKSIDGNHRETFFLRQQEKLSFNFTEKQVLTWLDRHETRHLESLLPSTLFSQPL